MTQKHLSKLSGISTSMISAIELGERHPTVPVLDALARALQVKVTDLYSLKF
jgi:transcriptional regulator with XRE-family HTH domain